MNFYAENCKNCKNSHEFNTRITFCQVAIFCIALNSPVINGHYKPNLSLQFPLSFQ